MDSRSPLSDPYNDQYTVLSLKFFTMAKAPSSTITTNSATCLGLTSGFRYPCSRALVRYFSVSDIQSCVTARSFSLKVWSTDDVPCVRWLREHPRALCAHGVDSIT